MQQFLKRPSPSAYRHRTKSDEPSVEPSQHFQALHEARKPIHITSWSLLPSSRLIHPCPPRAPMIPAPLVRILQKARPGLNFEPGWAAGPELCIFSAHPHFLPKSGEHDVTLASFTADLSKPLKIPLVRVYEISEGRGTHCLVAISF